MPESLFGNPLTDRSTHLPASGPALQLNGLYKAFNETIAVNAIDLTVPRGSFFGLVGPNGAGKTTTLSMAVGLLRPDQGSVRIFGADVWENPARAKGWLGVLPDGLSLPERLTGRELLTYLGLLRGLNARIVTRRVEELLAVLDLTNAEHTLVIDYSTGMRKKIGLATALLHGPKVLVLDEPFEAVDPLSAATIKTILLQFVASGGSVVFSSHVMVLVEQLCSHVAVIARGKVVATGSVEQVRGDVSLEEAFLHLVGGHPGRKEGLSWLAF
jgi:ABC-2 type transport system ATP-binding protein